jgi:hypothetical protein
MILGTTTALALSMARAATIETLLMPGKVSQPHAKYEETCALCHDRGDRSRQTALCLDCHKETASDITKKTGLHGRMKNIATAQCKACHREHLGRAADIVKFDRTVFDHAGTDFDLEGAHRGLACVSCHQKGKKLRDASSTCGACHKDVDLHRGKLGEKCGACHSSSSWSGARFNHDKTDFALLGTHRDVRCNACHFGEKYDGTPTRCVACHMPDDVHRGSRGDNCAECHTQTNWKTNKFDHGKETGFSLLGRHNALECGSCHKTGKFDDEIPNKCIGCHRADDSHAGRFGEDCTSCHGNDRWSGLEYDHLNKAKWELLGAHADVDCHACHTANVAKQKLRTDCNSCHAANDPHGGALKDSCDTCHSNDAWRRDIRFDHDLTDFPLLGMHVLVSCAQCHSSKAFKGAPTACIGCHKQNDVHQGGLGRDCAACHSSNGWANWEFDHQKQTGFALTGAHGQAKCVDCHRQPAAVVKLAKDCAACHRSDDVHLGQFGMQCQRCHSTISFKGARIQ